MNACRNGDLETVQKLFESREASPFDLTEHGESPLELAIESANANLVAFLLENGTDPNTIVNEVFGMTVLQLALYHRDVDIVRLLLSYEACPWQTDSTGWTNMFYLFAVTRGDDEAGLDCLRILVMECCFPPLVTRDADGWTILHRAAAFGSLEMVRLLIAQGADPTERLGSWIPAHQAVDKKRHTVLNELLPAEFDINYQDSGADPHVKGAPSNVYWKVYHHMGAGAAFPAELTESPWDLANEIGGDCLRTFVEAAQSAGIDLYEDDEGDIFWLAENKPSD
ncbi:MAG: hypothetical protein M1834_005069 [Cirrosporium novae-zelandiae]|nr:MAG: hypothetical protein M1834_005069 [Cirrosporium novae-zelandiae]